MSKTTQYTLSGVCTLITDGAHESPISVEVGYPMASVKDMNYFDINIESCRLISKEDYFRLSRMNCKPLKDDVLIAKDGSYLKHINVVDTELDMVILSSIAILRPDKTKILPYYLKYYLLNDAVKSQLSNGYVTGTALKRIILKNFKDFIIKIPSLPEQQNVIDKLSLLDSKIELNNQINKDLEELAQTLYTKWFVNFDFPNEEGKPYKSSGGEMVESEMGLIPKGWSVEVVQNLLSISYGKNLPKNKFKKNGFNVYGANGVVGFYDEFMFEDCKVICGCRGTVGNVYMTTKKSFITNNSLIFSSECLPNEFVYFGLKNLIPKVISGSVQKQITVEAFNGLNFLFPENKVLNDFKSIINPLFEMINSNIEENDYLSKLRDTILPHLMNGTIIIK